MTKIIGNYFNKMSRLALIVSALILLLLGVRHASVRRQQLNANRRLKQQVKQKIIEVQNAQFKASNSIRSGRDELSKRMRSGRF